MQFKHEIMPDPIDPEKEAEIVSFNGIVMMIADFLVLEPGYASLPAGIKGINYVPGKYFYAYNTNGNVVASPVTIEVLDSFLARQQVYVDAILIKENLMIVQGWDEGTVGKNHTKRKEEVRKEAHGKLSQSDWYFIRNQENASPISQVVKDYRVAVRAANDQAIIDIGTLTVTADIKNFQASWPIEPEGI